MTAIQAARIKVANKRKQGGKWQKCVSQYNVNVHPIGT